MLARELSIFIDESGGRGGKARYYLLVLVLHDQSDRMAGIVQRYEQSLSMADLPNIPFHSEPLLNGHGSYENLGIHQRKRMLIAFAGFVCHLPTSYSAFSYRRKESRAPAALPCMAWGPSVRGGFLLAFPDVVDESPIWLFDECARGGSLQTNMLKS